MFIEKYEKPRIERYALLYSLSPAGGKLGHGIFPFTGRYRERSQRPRENTMIGGERKTLEPTFKR